MVRCRTPRLKQRPISVWKARPIVWPAVKTKTLFDKPKDMPKTEIFCWNRYLQGQTIVIPTPYVLSWGDMVASLKPRRNFKYIAVGIGWFIAKRTLLDGYLGRPFLSNLHTCSVASYSATLRPISRRLFDSSFALINLFRRFSVQYKYFCFSF